MADKEINTWAVMHYSDDFYREANIESLIYF